MNVSRCIEFVVRALLVLASIALVVMATIIAFNIFGRALFHRPILGTIEYAGVAGVIFASVAVGYVEKQRRNVVMEVVSSKLPPRVKAFTDAFGLLLGLGIIGVLTWAMFREAAYAASYGQTTLVMGIPLAPFKYIWAVGTALLCVALLNNIVQCIRRGVKR
jgi:TRAP-type C4-dicarboxylate transport system permease small subunit